MTTISFVKDYPAIIIDIEGQYISYDAMHKNIYSNRNKIWSFITSPLRDFRVENRVKYNHDSKDGSYNFEINGLFPINYYNYDYSNVTIDNYINYLIQFTQFLDDNGIKWKGKRLTSMQDNKAATMIVDKNLITIVYILKNGEIERKYYALLC
jgi:hypothetical protein